MGLGKKVRNDGWIVQVWNINHGLKTIVLEQRDSLNWPDLNQFEPFSSQIFRGIFSLTLALFSCLVIGISHPCQFLWHEHRTENAIMSLIHGPVTDANKIGLCGWLLNITTWWRCRIGYFWKNTKIVQKLYWFCNFPNKYFTIGWFCHTIDPANMGRPLYWVSYTDMSLLN